MDNFGCLNSTCVISVLLRIYEKNYSVRTLTDEPHPSPIRVSTLLAGAPLPPLSVRTLWMIMFINFEIFSDSPKLIGTPNPPATTTPHHHHPSPVY